MAAVFLREDINFLVTNRIPRRYATLLLGWFSRVRSRRLTKASIATWRLFAPDLELEEARNQNFVSLRDCFIRQLREGARPLDPDPRAVTSPCDAVIGAFGTTKTDQVIQAKGFPYNLIDLLNDKQLVAKHQGGKFITLRLRSSMYHRFHAPCDARISRVKYLSGDTWNVNPIALKRVERLFCKNERAVLPLEVSDGQFLVTLVPIAAILVASIRLHFLSDTLNLKYRGAAEIPCDATFKKGQEIGYFENGSTIVMLTTPDFEFSDNVIEGSTIRVGERLFDCRLPLSKQIGEDDERFNRGCI